jgi:hypothetical protein
MQIIPTGIVIYVEKILIKKILSITTKEMYMTKNVKIIEEIYRGKILIIYKRKIQLPIYFTRNPSNQP